MWNTAGISAAAWGRLLLLAFGVFVVTELDKIWGPVLLTPWAAPLAERIGDACAAAVRPITALMPRFCARTPEPPAAPHST